MFRILAAKSHALAERRLALASTTDCLSSVFEVVMCRLNNS